ncbi:MAG: FtsW/RodA/SpoVE family cell cycle protein [Suipraeoptans sp.]
MNLKKFLKPVTKSYNLKGYKFILAISVLALSIVGVLAVGSARHSLQSRQITGVVFGCIAMIIISLIDYKWVLRMYWLLYILCNISLLLVLIMGDVSGGAKRWIDFGFIRFQPSELAKILLILFLAQFIVKHKDNLNTPGVLIQYALLCGIPLFLIISEPSLSSTITIALILIVLLFVGGLSFKIIGSALLVIIPIAIIFFSYVVQPDQKLLPEYQRGRIMAFLEPDQYDDLSYQQNNSEMAIGSGQLNGKGLNNNTTTSVKKGNFIDEPQTDFIFAIIGEELGFIGCMVIIALILIIVIQCIAIGIKSSDFGGRLICCGVGGWIGIQSFINIGVATNILPNTGVPLPFVSYGLTSLLCLFAGVGFVLNVGLQSKK